MELQEVAVPYLSIGSLLAPVSWTMDMQSSHVPFSVPMRSHTGSSFRYSSCWSSNTVRFERFDGSGNTLYITEVFAFHRDTTGISYECNLKGELGELDSKRTHRPQYEESTCTQNLQALLPRRSSGTPLKIWAVKVTEGDMSGIPESQAKATFSPRFISKVAWLRSQNYEVFLHISLDAFDRLPESTTCAIERIFQDAICKYRKPHIKVPYALLPAFSTLDSTALCGKVSIHNNSGVPMLCSDDPLVADERLSCFFCASAIFTSLGKALLVLRQRGGCEGHGVWQPIVWNVRNPRHPYGSGDAYPRFHTLPNVYASETNDGCQDTKTSQKRRPVSYDLVVNRTDLDNGSDSMHVVALLQRVVSHTLRLNTTENLYMGMPRESEGLAAGAGCDSDVDSHTAVSSGGVMSLRAVCLASLPLTTDVASIYNYRSVEYAFERHVGRTMHDQRGADKHKGDSHARDYLDDMELIKIHSFERFVPSHDFLHVVQERLREETAWDTANRVYTSMDFKAVSPSHVPPRRTLYGLRRRSVPHQEKNYQLHDRKLLLSQGGGRPEDTSQKQMENFLFVVELIAPRVDSTHAIVLVAAVETGTVIEPDEAREGTAIASVGQLFHRTVLNRYKEAAALLSMTFFLEFPHPTLWKLSCATGDMSGFFFRQGHLLLRIPSGDPRYYDTTVRPNAAKCFTSLGSFLVQTSFTPSCQKGQDSCHGEAQQNCLCAPLASLEEGSAVAISVDHSVGVGSTAACTISQPSVYSSSVFKSISAVWTLLSDGRSSDEFIDFYISEFYYLTGVMNINNVDRRTSAVEHGETVLTVRKRLTRSQASSSGLSRRGEGKEAIAWLDMGLHHRLYVCARECGVGRVLLIQASIILREDLQHKCVGDDMSEQRMSECEEASLEAWVDSIAVGSIGT
ncbi:unnamed protein product [Phytomonas sp. EM1]|nr:unnamed protein product [Phytomonas sp. EM1]|eukprot:CCW64547.1 unnamed protein product [Phytomonas sp. isolate EM1]